MESLRTSKAAGLASVVSKVDSDWPTSKIMSNKTIDIWWVIHDGGLIILLSYLLKQNVVWKNCRLRLFAVAEENDNSIKMVSNSKLSVTSKIYRNFRISSSENILTELNSGERFERAFEATSHRCSYSSCGIDQTRYQCLCSRGKLAIRFAMVVNVFSANNDDGTALRIAKKDGYDRYRCNRRRESPS